MGALSERQSSWKHVNTRWFARGLSGFRASQGVGSPGVIERECAQSDCSTGASSRAHLDSPGVRDPCTEVRNRESLSVLALPEADSAIGQLEHEKQRNATLTGIVDRLETRLADAISGDE